MSMRLGELKGIVTLTLSIRSKRCFLIMKSTNRALAKVLSIRSLLKERYPTKRSLTTINEDRASQTIFPRAEVSRMPKEI